MSNRTPVDIDLGATARAVIADLAPLAAAKAIDLGLNETPGVHMRGDADAVATLVSNLVDNAVRYSSHGGRVDVLVRSDDGAALLEVRDDGPGISLEDRERVFDRFYRGAAARAAGAARGSGLGLAIVRRIAERHGATVTLGSGVNGKGLGVALRFPGVVPTLSS